MRWSEELQRPPAPWELVHKDSRSKCGQGACAPREHQPRQAQPRVTGAQPCPSFPVSFCPAYLIGGDPGRRASVGAHLPPLLPEPPPLWETLLSSFRAKVKSRCSRGRSLETRWGTAGCSHTHPIARPCPPVTRSSSSSGCPGPWAASCRVDASRGGTFRLRPARNLTQIAGFLLPETPPLASLRKWLSLKRQRKISAPTSSPPPW